MCGHPAVTLQIMLLSAGGYEAMGCPSFTICWQTPPGDTPGMLKAILEDL
jgi:hypothetical protein